MEPIESAVRLWLETVVIGLNLCPFAAAPLRAERVRIRVSEAVTELALLTELELELKQLHRAPEVETTLIVVPQMLAAFADYNDFLDTVDAHLEAFEWAGEFQVASFHPHYQFAGTQAEDAENLTNRSPYPLLHLLRESSLDAALLQHPDPDRIPKDNICRMQALSAEDRRRYFGYLAGPPLHGAATAVATP